MVARLSRFGFAVCALGLWSVPVAGWAQSITSAEDGTGTVVNQVGDRYTITGGSLSADEANLFHSFEQLGLEADEIAIFLSQPNIDNILGRVVGGDASFIDGLIQLQGGTSNLYLMNPAGIVFGPNALLDLPASFFATTANGIGFGENWFDAVGDNTYVDLVGTPDSFAFSLAEPGAIANLANLAVNPGESLTLLGGTVTNMGTLTAPGGTITLAAVPGENRVRLSQAGSLLSLELDAANGTWDTALAPSTFTPLALPELLTGGDLQPASQIVVNPDGTIQLAGATVPVEAGTTLVSGTLDASGTAEAEINVLGDRVALLDATLDGSGTNGGGTLRIGGDYRGAGSVFNASRTVVSADSVITADALEHGTGGRIFLWADDTTSFAGSLSAQGGRLGGDGGFVEVSGEQNLIFRGTADVSAPQGSLGTLLLDPENLIIANGAGGAEDGLLGAGQILEGQGAGLDYTISEAALEALNGDANVILEATNNIVINDLADNTLNFAPGAGTITFTADADGNGVGAFTMLDPNDTVQALGRSLTITAADITAGNINLGDATVAAAGNDDATLTLLASQDITTGTLTNSGRPITATSENGGITTGNITTYVANGNGGSVSLRAFDRIETGEIDTWVNAGSGGNLDLILTGPNGAITTERIWTLTFDFNSGGDVNINANGGTVTTGSIDSYANRSNEQGGDIVISGDTIFTGDLNNNGLSGFGPLDARSGIITFNATGSITTGNINNKDSPVTFNGALILDDPATSIVIRGNLGGNVTFNGMVDGTTPGTQSLSVDAGAGNVVFEDSVGSLVGLNDLVVNSSGTTQFTGSVNTSSLTTNIEGNTTLNGDVTTTGPAGQIYNDAVTVTGNTILTANELTFLLPVVGTGTLTLQPFTNNQAIALGGATDLGVGTFDLLATDLAALTDGFSSITIGRANGSGAITLAGDVVFSDPVRLRSLGQGGTINTTGGTLTGTDNATLTLQSQGNITTADILNPGRNITLTSTGGDVDTTAGTISTGYAPETANRGVLTPPGGAIRIEGERLALGTVNTSIRSGLFADANFRQNAGNIELEATSGNITATALSSEVFSFGGALGFTGLVGNAGAITVNAPVGDVTVTGGITTNATAVGAGDQAGNAGAIAISSGNGLVTVGGQISSQALLGGGAIVGAGGNVALTGTSVNVNGINASRQAAGAGQSGNIILSGDEVNWTAPLVSPGTLSIQPLTTTQPIRLGGTTDTNNNTILNIVDNEWAAIQGGGFATINIGRADGDHPLTFVTPVTTNDATVFRGIRRVTGSNTDTTWTISDPNSASVYGFNFTNVQALGGGTANDTFAFLDGATFGGAISGGDGTDVYDYSTSTEPVLVDLASLRAVGIESIIGSTIPGVVSTLIGQNQDNTWTFTDATQGTVNDNTFTNFQRFQGGSENDTVILADGLAFTSEVSGGAGNLTIQGSTFQVQGDITADGDINITGTGDVAVESAIASTTGGIQLISDSGSLDTTQGTLDTSASGEAIALTAPISLAVGNVLTNGPVTLNTDGTLDLSTSNLGSQDPTAATNTPAISIGNDRVPEAIRFAGDRFFSNGGDVRINASGDYQLETEINTAGASAGGLIDIRSDRQLTLTRNLITRGGRISLSGSSVTAQDLDSRFEQGGGRISVTATDADIVTGNINAAATGDGNGGDVEVNAITAITTGTIDTSSAGGNGGNVTLDPIDDIEVEWINTSSSSGRGGNVDITAGRFFRATGSFLSSLSGREVSISTEGQTEGGSITIRHGGDGVVPFVIGSNFDANGTRAAVVTGTASLDEGESFLEPITRGNITLETALEPITRGNITLETATRSSTQPSPTLFQNLESDTSDEDTEEDETEEATEAAEEEETVSFADILVTQENLNLLQQQLGISPALIYVSFGPTGLQFGNDFERQEATASTAVAQHLNQRNPVASPLLNLQPQASDELELLIVTGLRDPVRIRVEGVTRQQVLEEQDELMREVNNPSRLGTRSYLPSAQQLYDWLIRPMEETLTEQQIGNLAFIMGEGLRTLPIAVLHDKESEQFLVERYSVGMMPSLSLTDTRYVDIRNLPVLAMGASRFDALPPLPAVPSELEVIASSALDSVALLNDEFTQANLLQIREERPFGIVHMATHARFLPGALENSYIEFGDRRLTLDQVRQLGLNDPSIELLVLSACETAVGDPQAELGFGGLAVQIGARSVLASLWSVDDTGTLVFMTEFYRQLRQAPFRADALRQTQIAFLRGEARLEDGQMVLPDGSVFSLPIELRATSNLNLRHPYYWSTFTMIGSPW